jgi:hypothetical protein
MRAASLLVLAALTPAVLVAQYDPSVSSAVESITPDDVAHRIGVLAHDSMRGRETPSPELDQAAEYVGAQFRHFGLTPAGDDGSFIQRYTVRTVRPDLSTSTVQVEGESPWYLGTDVARWRGFTDREGVTGRVVVVSGVPDEPDGLAQLDLEGAVVVWVVPMAFGARFGREHFQWYRALRSLEPAALVLVTRAAEQDFQQRMRQGARRDQRFGSDPVTPVVQVQDPTIGQALNRHGFDLRDARRATDAPLEITPLPELKLTVTLTEEVLQEVTAPNTVGILEGSDPTLKDEFLVFSAHMDHEGIGRPIRGDSIYNGADDNASGTVAIVELAEAFAMLQPRPRRSIIFLTVSGEEKGLWGSEAFAESPPVPVEQIVANLNADMVGRNWPDTISVIGKEHSDLGTTLHRVADDHPELKMTPVDDLWPRENFYFRSDHIHFARRGVPILFFFNGTHEDYHRPSDEPEKIDAEKESRIVKLMFYLGLEIANANARPQWDPESYQTIVQPR